MQYVFPAHTWPAFQPTLDKSGVRPWETSPEVERLPLPW